MEIQGKVEKQKIKRENWLLIKFFLGFGEGEKGAEGREEEPLDGGVFEYIVGEGRGFEGEEKDEHDAKGYLEPAPSATHAVTTDMEASDEREVEDKDSNPDHTTFNKEFHKIIVRIIGTMRGTTETLRDARKGIHTGPEESVFFLDRVAGDVLPEGDAPEERAIWIRLETLAHAGLETLRKDKEDKGEEKERKEEQAIAKERDQEDKEKECDPGHPSKGEEKHEGKEAEEREDE